MFVSQNIKQKKQKKCMSITKIFVQCSLKILNVSCENKYLIFSIVSRMKLAFGAWLTSLKTRISLMMIKVSS